MCSWYAHRLYRAVETFTVCIYCTECWGCHTLCNRNGVCSILRIRYDTIYMGYRLYRGLADLFFSSFYFLLSHNESYFYCVRSAIRDRSKFTGYLGRVLGKNSPEKKSSPPFFWSKKKSSPPLFFLKKVFAPFF